MRSGSDRVVSLNEKKYDIGVVGVPTVENHGSNLSYYGLYRALKYMGYKVVMIERPKSAWWTPHDKPIIFRQNPYDEGDLCELFENKLQMQRVNAYADTFILGSDQLWYEGLYACFDKFCFLDYINQNKNKITYAASFGRNTYGATQEEKAEAACFVKGIDSVSVREESAVALCKEEWNIDAHTVLDPVFLCPTDEYNKLADKAIGVPYEKYIATYILDPSLEKQRIVEEVSKKMGLPVVNMTDVADVEDKSKQWNLKVERDIYNEDWLARVRDCDFFITDSFHGTCFAIIFGKEFLSIGNTYRGLDRFTEILGKLQLKERLVLENDDIKIDNLVEDKIDYVPVKKLLEVEIRKSVEWLRNAINKKKQNEFSLYDIIQKEMMNHDENIRWQKSVIDAHGNVIGAHDKRLAVYDQALYQLQNDVSERRIKFETQQLQMQEFQDAIFSLREENARLQELNLKMNQENEQLRIKFETQQLQMQEFQDAIFALQEEYEQLRIIFENKSSIKRLVKKYKQ